MNLMNLPSFLQEKCQIALAERILVGVSGGADSMALLHLLRSIAVPLVVYHFDHKIRPSSSADAEFVIGACRELGIQCEIGSVDVPEFAAAHRLGMEEAARMARYQALFRAAERHDCAAVAVAHHADDQLETILMHFIRGAGLDGLKGMLPRVLLPAFSQSIPLIRPLLMVEKAQILQYCRENQLSFREDETNADPAFFRNWLRLQLIPQIAAFNPKFTSNVLHASETLANDWRLLEKQVDEHWEQLDVYRGGGYIRFLHKNLLLLPPGLQYRIIRRLVQYLEPEVRDFDLAATRRVADWLTQEHPTGQIDLVGGSIARVIRENTYFLRRGVDVPIEGYPQLESPAKLVFPARISLNAPWVLQSEVLDRQAVPMEYVLHAPRWEAWLDLDCIEGEPQLGWKQPGDRFVPLGWQAHSARVSDIWLNEKVPAEARAKHPILRDSKGIIWLPGSTIAHRVRVTINTKRILRIRLFRADR